jgi:hypothetical protein
MAPAAAAHARHAWQQGVRVLLWVTASSRPAVIDAYADAAAKLGIGTRDAPERAAAEFLVWAETTNSSWLVILDDIQNLADLRDLWPPDSDVGQVVATTRLREPALSTSGRRLVNVDLFTPDEARAFLNAKLGDLAETDDQVDGLAGELGWLPLALAVDTRPRPPRHPRQPRILAGAGRSRLVSGTRHWKPSPWPGARAVPDLPLSRVGALWHP